MLVVVLPRTVFRPTFFTQVNAVGPTASGTVTAYQAAIDDSVRAVAHVIVDIPRNDIATASQSFSFPQSSSIRVWKLGYPLQFVGYWTVRIYSQVQLTELGC